MDLDGRDVGQELVAPDLATDEVGARVVAPHAEDEEQDPAPLGRRPRRAARRRAPRAPWRRRRGSGRSGPTYTAPNTVANQATSPSRGSIRENAPTPASTTPTATQQGALVAVGPHVGREHEARPRARSRTAAATGTPPPSGAGTPRCRRRSRRGRGPRRSPTARATARRAGPGRGRGPRGLGSAAPRALPAEPARAPGELEQRLVEGGRAEVRPQAVGEHELRVGGLPDEEVADPLLAAGADDEVGVRAGRPCTAPR